MPLILLLAPGVAVGCLIGLALYYLVAKISTSRAFRLLWLPVTIVVAACAILSVYLLAELGHKVLSDKTGDPGSLQILLYLIIPAFGLCASPLWFGLYALLKFYPAASSLERPSIMRYAAIAIAGIVLSSAAYIVIMYPIRRQPHRSKFQRWSLNYPLSLSLSRTSSEGCGLKLVKRPSESFVNVCRWRF